MKLFGPRGRPLERREQHLPEQVPVEAYGNGGFRFGGASVFACESEKENKRMNHRNYQKELDKLIEKSRSSEEAPREMVREKVNEVIYKSDYYKPKRKKSL